MQRLEATLYDHDISELPLPEGEPPFRRRQIASWVYGRGTTRPEEMTNLPLGLREWLSANHASQPFASFQRFESDDGSVRYLFTLRDGKQTEAVYMPYEGRRTVCVSSMVGCPAACAFCATGALGFGRNLTRGEIVAQLVEVARHEGVPPAGIRNVVLMGMGEALLNYENALGAIETWIDPAGLDMSPRRITLSTVGLPGRIRKLAGEGLPLVLAVSLHAPDQETRQRIIPTAHAHTVPDIMAALHDWQDRVGRRITIEYTMLEGTNDHPWQADMLAELLRGLTAHVNLIPFNPWGASGFQGSPRERITQFQKRLTDRGVSVSVRFSRGRDAGAACGQLALQGAGAAAVADSGVVMPGA
ncbi:MAG: 23S rRNA (adenine(2503)-C(2))-methyltransferase RlmN [Trueperaceae bacterium]|jgi:23S rRNA (adenine2503-C2)-methyltransferase|nr:23S rRNA (adenine(2503)-C(2))-methyltransferase RlmN [Truepera sp.]HRN19605.1 23S rRNA (adenine(2503)-C(2))-methyltransferase RlmN [Trueperaceae bacterium]HRQ10716.1 23S rRNA (adenine(2503)-C(2))-methyltransferase RlmN [Trueperaceae bacterium]